MESDDQIDSPAWSLWAKLVSPALLRYPVLGISAVLVVSTPIASAGTLPRSHESTSQPTQRQLRILRSYERYLTRVRAQTVKARRAVRFAYRQIGKPYQWGGAGPRTYDCSGLVMAAWRKAGLSLPHRADLQHRMIRRRVGIKHLQPGDLVFFSGDHHVGIYVGRRRFLHAPHTGARVQRGTLTGWRLRAFAGAARPGAPVYHAWPHWVRTLADQQVAHPGDRTRHSHDHPAADPELTPAPDAAQPPPVSADPPSESGTEPAPQEIEPPESEPASPADGLVSTLVPMSATAPTGRPARSGESQADTAPARVGNTAPAPPPGAPPVSQPPSPPAHRTVTPPEHQGPRSRPRPSRATVKRQHDEQRFDRDYDDRSVSDDDDEPTGDGIDWRTLLGNAP
jgi:hypothetical protein